MKESIDKYFTQRLRDLVVYKDHFTTLTQAFNDKVGKLKDDKLSEQEINSKLEEDSFELIVLRDDLMKTAAEIEIIVELYKKTQQELPEEYTEITSKIPDFKEGNRLSIFTFVVDGDKVVEREKGLLKTKLDLTRKSEVYNKFKNLK